MADSSKVIMECGSCGGWPIKHEGRISVEYKLETIWKNYDCSNILMASYFTGYACSKYLALHQ